MKTLGEVLKDARAEMQPPHTMRDIAMLTGLSTAFISEVENDSRKPSEASARILSTTYGVDYERFCALAGILGAQCKRYIKHNPEAVRLIRAIAAANLDDRELTNLIGAVEKMVSG